MVLIRKVRVKRPKKQYNSKQKAQEAVKLALDKKAYDVVVLDTRKSCDFCDYFVIASADTDRQIEAVSRGIIEGLGEQGFKLRKSEGRGENNWILLDYNDVIIHIFHPETRSFYDLERLWQEARQLKLPSTLKHGPAKHRKGPS